MQEIIKKEFYKKERKTKVSYIQRPRKYVYNGGETFFTKHLKIKRYIDKYKQKVHK